MHHNLFKKKENLSNKGKRRLFSIANESDPDRVIPAYLQVQVHVDPLSETSKPKVSHSKH